MRILVAPGFNHRLKSVTMEAARSTVSRRHAPLAFLILLAGTIAVLTPHEAVGKGLCDFRLPGAIVGTPGNDILVGTSQADAIYGLGGDDRIRGLGGTDELCGGPGDDRILGGNGFSNDGDRLFGGSGDDVVISVIRSRRGASFPSVNA